MPLIQNENGDNEVTLVNIKIPFIGMVILIFKFTLALIIVLFTVFLLLYIPFNMYISADNEKLTREIELQTSVIEEAPYPEELSK